MSERGIHPEDAAIYAQEQHAALVRIGVALERIAAVLEDPEHESTVNVKQSGAWTQTSYQVTP